MHKLPFAVLAITLVFALTTCKNPWINELLKSPSELASLEVVAFAGETRLQGGAAFEPPFSAAVRDYLVYVPLETSRFTVNAGYDGNGNITWTTQGMDGAVSSNSFTFRFHDIEDTLELTMAVERENMDIGIYRLAVIRTDNIPPPNIIEVTVTPSVGTYFLNAGVVPVVGVNVEPPTDGGTLSYQWFRNEDDNNVTGTLLQGATGTSYTLSGFEIEEATTMYYYVEITKLLDGKTNTLASKTRSVSFIDRTEVLQVKSGQVNEVGHYWVKVPAGTVPSGSTWEAENIQSGNNDYQLPWSTNGFLMGRYPVTYELWETVRTYAEKESYRFGNVGNQGAKYFGGGNLENTDFNPVPVGNVLHPVTMIGWRDAIVWCNALSEMDGLEPVYRDSSGKVLQDSRQRLEVLINHSKTTGKNGYRLPTCAEQEYAARGASPSTGSPWTDQYPGTDHYYEVSDYVWGRRHSDGSYDDSNFRDLYTGPVGSLLPNTIGLYDITGMVQEYTYARPDWLAANDNIIYTLGESFRGDPATEFKFTSYEYEVYSIRSIISASQTYGFRLIRYEAGE